MHHLSVRIPWNDSSWAGFICNDPSKNCSCLINKRIRETRNDQVEERMCGKNWKDIDEEHLPACLRESGAALNDFAYSYTITHPYANVRSLGDEFSNLLPTKISVPRYSVISVPFRWLTRNGAQAIAKEQHIPYDEGKERRFSSKWLNIYENQKCMLDAFFQSLVPEHSLLFLYTKKTPLSDDKRRVLVGVGRITKVASQLEYTYKDPADFRNLIWERPVSHTIRLDGKDGFILPYQKILAVCERENLDPSRFACFVPQEAVDAFSYASELVDHDTALACMLELLDGINIFEQYHIDAPWNTYRQWISDQLSKLWQYRGAFPGLGNALDAFGIPFGTVVAVDLAKNNIVDGQWQEDPWVLLEKAYQGDTHILSEDVFTLLKPIDGKRLRALTPERKELLHLLSRFSLSSKQIQRFFDDTFFLQAKEILENPYRLFEVDCAVKDAVSFGVIDRGMFVNQAQRYPLPIKAQLEGDLDPRRVRALAVALLRAAEGEGHTLLPVTTVLEQMGQVCLDPVCKPTKDILPLLEAFFPPEIVPITISEQDQAWQLARRYTIKQSIEEKIAKRKAGRRHTKDCNWRALIDQKFGPIPEGEDAQLEEDARAEKAAALQELFSSRFSVLLGCAGTGKTCLLQILCSFQEIIDDGFLLLAPTGKARVQMERNIAGVHAKTIAQFLYSYERYNSKTHRYSVTGDAARRYKVGTVIIDEASMLTEDMLAAVFDAVRGVKRFILVGDQFQLPPIGAGCPLVDIAKYLAPKDREFRKPRVAPCYAELMVERRQKARAMQRRDDSLLASWFRGDSHDFGADQIWDKIASGSTDEHLKIVQWESDEDLKEKLLCAMVANIDSLKSDTDEVGFEVSLGGRSDQKRQITYFPQGSAALCESWQLLTPVRASGHGVEELNRFFHERFRAKALRMARSPFAKTPRPKGSQRIIYGDKVIAKYNECDRAVVNSSIHCEKSSIANGEVGIVIGESKFGQTIQSSRDIPTNLHVEFSTQLGTSFIYTMGKLEDSDDEELLDLAYALTVHKSQGSQFSQVFVILPNPCYLLSRELIYTALTRQVDRVIVFVQGDAQSLFQYTSSLYSELAKRYTNLFTTTEMVRVQDTYLASKLIHRTERGDLVRSISEVVIANIFHEKGLDYAYEEPLRAEDGSIRLPDFTIDDDESGIRVYWEHLGMLHNQTYRRSWEEKVQWYAKLGLIPDGPANAKGEMLVTSQNAENGALDSVAIVKKIEDIFSEA